MWKCFQKRPAAWQKVILRPGNFRSFHFISAISNYEDISETESSGTEIWSSDFLLGCFHKTAAITDSAMPVRIGTVRLSSIFSGSDSAIMPERAAGSASCGLIRKHPA